MANEPTFQIPKDVIEPIIQAQVSSAVLAALGDKTGIVERAVAAVLNMKVDIDGKTSTYGGHNDVPWVQWLMRDCVRKATRLAVEEFFAQNKELVKTQIAAELRKKNSPMAKQLINAMVGAVTNESTLKYRLNVTVE